MARYKDKDGNSIYECDVCHDTSHDSEFTEMVDGEDVCSDCIKLIEDTWL